MQDPKRNNNQQLGDNPYSNDKLYPIYMVVSVSFLDSYIQNNLHSYDVILPGNPKYKGSTTIYLRDIYEEFSKFLDTISKKITKVSDFLNENNLAKLRELYDNFIAESQEFCEKRVSELAKDSYVKSMYDDETLKKVMGKEIFLEFLKEKIVNENVLPEVANFNSDSHSKISFIKNNEILYCANFFNGIIQTLDMLNDRDQQYQINYLTNVARDLIHNYTVKYKKKTDFIFLIDIHLLVNVKGRPFMILTNVNEKNINDKTITVTDSNSFINSRYNNTYGNNEEENHNEDDYDDWYNDEDDDNDDNDDEM